MDGLEVPFFDMGAHYQEISAELNRALLDTAKSAHYILGPKLVEFENQFANYCGAKFAVGVGNGLDAIRLALKAVNVGAGDEVIVPGHTFIATALAVLEAGATPVFVDVKDETFNLDPQKIEGAITSKTRAVIAVHLYGRPAPMSEIMEVASRHSLIVIEDAAQAHGASLEGVRVGAFGKLAAFSFYPTKNLGAMGDAGAVVTSDPHLRRRLLLLRNYGQSERYVHIEQGTNTRLDEIQAAVLSIKLKYLEAGNKKRRALAHAYGDGLRDLKGLRLPTDCPGHVYHLYVVRSEKRDALSDHLKSDGIGSLIHYPMALHQHRAMGGVGRVPTEGLPVSEDICRQALSLPLFPEMTMAQVNRVCKSIRAFLG